ncbi:MAG: GNAT family N-acetyltransferase [Actinobacteria bacterium]|nr:GNAT family N-acetyltransferase [Actinomycetota bacterium]
MRGWLTECVDLVRSRSSDVDALAGFLRDIDLTLSGLDSPTVRLWLVRDEHGGIIGSTGYELSADGQHALVRSVAVSRSLRSRGRGNALSDTHQVRLFQQTGQLGREVAWSRILAHD